MPEALTQEEIDSLLNAISTEGVDAETEEVQSLSKAVFSAACRP